MTDEVHVYKMDVVVIDHDGLGPDGARRILEDERYPNHCMSPKVVALDERVIQWSDDHPLNKTEGQREALDTLFAPPGRCLHHTDGSGPDEYFVAPFDPPRPVACPCPGGCPGMLRVDGWNVGDTLVFLVCDACACAHVAKDGRAASEPSASETKLAKILVQIVDQVARGSHGPTLMQLLQAISALREAAPRLDEELRGHIQQVFEVLQKAVQDV